MTKQQPCASKLRLSKICRWLIALGIAKLALFGAWSVDMPLPSMFQTAAVPAAKETPANTPAAAAPAARQAEDIRLSALFAERKESAEAKAPPASGGYSGRAPAAVSPENRPAPNAPPAASADEPRFRSAAPLPSMPAVPLPWDANAGAQDSFAQAANDGHRPLASGVDADSAAARNEAEAAADTWWNEILTLTELPVPTLGALQIANAAAMDTPPPPLRSSAQGASPFTPPEQTQARSMPASGGQQSSAPPLPLRPRPNAPQTSTGMPSAPSAISPNAPPAPATGAFLSPDSPESKQQELARREQDVLMLKQQMESRLQDLQSTEKKVQSMLKEAHGVHDQKIKHLISAYTNMKPKQAALAMESLEERLAVRILAGMNPKQAGEVLTYANPKTVAKLSELLARMQLPAE